MKVITYNNRINISFVYRGIGNNGVKVSNEIERICQRYNAQKNTYSKPFHTTNEVNGAISYMPITG